jgi:hypothetical protein
MKKNIKGWVMEDDDGFMWFDVPPSDWVHYDKKFYNATLTVDLNSDLTIEQGE